MKIQQTLTEIWGIAKERQRERKGERSVLTFIDGISTLTCKPHAKNLIAVQLNIYIALYHFFKAFWCVLFKQTSRYPVIRDTKLLCSAAAGELRQCLFSLAKWLQSKDRN